MIIVDTSVWIDFLNGTPSPEKQFLHQLLLDEKEVYLTGVIFTEILQGIKDNTMFNKAKDYLLAFPRIEPESSDTFIRAAILYRKCRMAGKTIRSTIDCIIAQIAIENGFSILHRDRDFTFIAACLPELDIISLKDVE